MLTDNNQEVFTKTSINCLPCIYTVHRLNPYRMEVFKNCDVASFNKKRLNIAHFWEELGYWFVTLWHFLIIIIKY